MTLHPIPSEFSYIWGKFCFLISTCRAEVGGVYLPFQLERTPRIFIRDCGYSERVGRANPPPPKKKNSPGWADFSIMMECTPESGHCGSSVYNYLAKHLNFVCGHSNHVQIGSGYGSGPASKAGFYILSKIKAGFKIRILSMGSSSGPYHGPDRCFCIAKWRVVRLACVSTLRSLLPFFFLGRLSEFLHLEKIDVQ